MKYLSKIQKAILGLFLMLLVAGINSSCTKKFQDYNTDPNNPVSVPSINILTNAEESGISRQLGGWIQHTYLGVWCQQWCKVQYIDEDKYMPRDMSGEFQAPYTGELKNLTIVIKQATAEGNLALAAAAKVLRVWGFMYLTDVWGDIPYSQALQGFDISGTLTPQYDTQASIYADFLVQLEDANTALAATTVNFGSGDLFYGGDPAEWRKFANTLKLRILNRAAGTPWTFTYDMVGGTQVTTTPGAAAMADADTRIAAILADPTTYPIFTSNDDNVKLAFPGLPYRNPIFDALYSRTDQAISQTMVNWLKARNDPRLIVYAQPTPNSVATPPLLFTGFQNGRGITSAYFPDVSLLGTAVAYNENAPLYLLTYDEVQFIIAEYNMRKGDDAAAQTAYEAGITASMERWGLVDGSNVFPSWGKQYTITTGTTAYPVNYATYLADPLVAWGGTDAEKFQKICEQRWAAIFGEGVQAYSEVRRTGFPARIFEYALEGSFYPGLGLPIRVQYALSEDTYNTANVAAARLSQNIESINEGMFSTDGIKSQVWWNTRKNPIPQVTDVP